MDSDVQMAIEQIDAAIFSGDTFIEPEDRSLLRAQMARWERGLSEFDRTFPNGAQAFREL
jgi:hypothetical protein